MLPSASTANERTALESFLQKWPDHLMARLWLTRHFLRGDDPAAALNVIGEMNEPADDLWQFWYWRGTAFLAAGQLDQARTDIEKAMEGAPEVAYLWIQNAALEQQLVAHARDFSSKYSKLSWMAVSLLYSCLSVAWISSKGRGFTSAWRRVMQRVQTGGN